MNTMTHTVYTGVNNSNNQATPYSLVKPSQAPAVSRRFLEDWANIPTNQPRGLRSDLHALLSKLNPHYADALTALLWVSIIPTTMILGSLITAH